MNDRRQAQRSIATFKSAYVLNSAGIHFVTLRNISETGICFDACPGVSVGDEITFSYDSEGPKSGTVRWVADGRFGVSASIGQLPGSCPSRRPLRSVRLPMSLKAELFVEGRREQVAIHNLSLRGTCIDSVPGLRPGQLVSIEIGGRSFELATVRWQAAHRAGICFAKPVAPHEFRALVERLQRCAPSPAAHVMPWEPGSVSELTIQPG